MPPPGRASRMEESARPHPAPAVRAGSAPSPLVRLAGVSGAAALAFLASPGVAGAGGSVTLAVLALALWAWTVARPVGPRWKAALLAEWLGGALAGGLMMWWVVHVVFFGVLYIGAGWGIYAAVMGACLRRLARAFPLPLAAGLAWNGVELVRALVPPPFGLGWFRLGFYAHDDLWLSGSARVLGVEGLTFVLASLGGGVAALALERRVRPAVALTALAPLVLAAVLARLVPAPATIDGPRVLLVQPGFTQERKQHDDAQANLEASRDLTHQAVAASGPVDLVCWGESMLYIPVLTPAAEAALRAGTAEVPPWAQPVTVTDVEKWKRAEDFWVGREVMALGGRGERPFPAGASFMVGVEYYDLDVAPGGRNELRRRVALALYDQAGQRSTPAFKRHLVPLGETFFGLERFAWVRDLAQSAAGYLPDFQPGAETGILELRARDGRTYRMSGTVCFDNAHPWPYVDALRGDTPEGGPVDFHLVASNEAWYGTSCEMDQMVAFSRVFALMTGRAFVRATNSGVSLVLGPDGRELGRVRDGTGADRAVPGFLAASVPVPPPGSARATPYVAWSRLSEGLWLALLAGGLLTRRSARAGNRLAEAG